MEESTSYIQLRVSEVKRETMDVATIRFDEASSRLISYNAGQYITLVFPGIAGTVRRSYSISSSPKLGELLAITVKRVDNGEVSRQLTDRIRTGDVLQTLGAAGFFTLPENISIYQQIFLLAAGSGITPIISIIKTALHQHPHLHFILIYSNRSEKETIFYKELNELQAANPERLKIIYRFSDNKDLRQARLYRESLLGLIGDHIVKEKHKVLAYICGPVDYMRMCTYTLREAGLSDEQIKIENFTTIRKGVPVQPPDQKSREVLIRYKGDTHRVQVNYPDTILSAARKSGMVLPYSCEAGLCGNCAARIAKGEVWMSYNEVLTDKETSRGLTLMCVGHPVGGDVELVVDNSNTAESSPQRFPALFPALVFSKKWLL